MRAIRIIALCSGLFTAVLLIGMFWVTRLWRDAYDQGQLDYAVERAKSAPELPTSFVKTLRSVYPTVLEHGYSMHLLRQLSGDREYGPCPCRQLALTVMPDHSQMKQSGRPLYPVSFTWALEDRVTQEQCMALLLDQYDFMNGIRGIEKASLKYYGDSLTNLNDDQYLELILRIKNPVLYNKARRPELFTAEFERLKRLSSKHRLQ